MWGTKLFQQQQQHYHGGKRTFATKTEKTIDLPKIDRIDPNKRFQTYDQQQEQQSSRPSSMILERCTKFINQPNGYPNNPRKEHIIPESTMGGSNRSRKYNKRAKTRTRWHKYDDIDEVGVDACCDDVDTFVADKSSAAVVVDEPPTTINYLTGSTSPIQCLQSRIMEVVLKSSPICIKISTPVYFSISPPRWSFKPPNNTSNRQPIKQQQRQISECSDDSNSIVFFDDGDNENNSSDDLVTDDANESDDEEENMHESSLNKRVRFADGKDLATVHHMYAWSYAYNAHRKGHWEEYARDRARFQRRIDCCAKKLNRILDHDHRAQIYRERFE